ncbi:MAG: hypothetical protein ACKVH8_14770 [Pirellulales bacterium]|jgi:hypothetical protein
MNDNPRSHYVQTVVPAIVLIIIGITLYGEPYFKQAQRQLLLASAQDFDFLSTDRLELEYEEEFVNHQDQTCHLFVFSKPPTSNWQQGLNRVVITDSDYGLIISDDQMSYDNFSNAALLKISQPILEMVWQKQGDPERVFTSRFDVSSSGIQATQQVSLAPLKSNKKILGKHVRKRFRNRKSHSTTG